MEIINFKKKKLKLLKKKQHKLYKNEKLCSISKEKFEHKQAEDKKYIQVKLRIIVVIQRNIEVL